MQQVYIAAAVRTPIGSFGGQFSDISATRLGAEAIKGALAGAALEPGQVEEVFMGNVCSANLGQAPARQAALYAGLPNTVPCTTVNKVCSSGAKAIMFGAQSIMLGQRDMVVAGGMENMSQIPYYLPKARYGMKYGHGEILDGLLRDGLLDIYHQEAMGVFADRTAERYGISREEQDAFAICSYQRSAAASENGSFAREIVPVEVPQRKGAPLLIREDEEFRRVDFAKIPGLRPAFSPNGTVTAANASTINDGASALILVGERKLNELNLKPLARILSFADAAHEPEWFTTAPAKAASLALKAAGLSIGDIDYVEVNEAFSVVALAFMKMMDLPSGRVNVFGGAVSLGHPLGASGARIVATLNNVLHQHKGRYGLAAICNGGGGASALVIEAL